VIVGDAGGAGHALAAGQGTKQEGQTAEARCLPESLPLSYRGRAGSRVLALGGDWVQIDHGSWRLLAFVAVRGVSRSKTSVLDILGLRTTLSVFPWDAKHENMHLQGFGRPGHPAKDALRAFTCSAVWR
jgi:hypothetical protein